MPDYGQELRFGVFVPPVAEQAGAVLELAQLADAVGLDYVTFQDVDRPSMGPGGGG